MPLGRAMTVRAGDTQRAGYMFPLFITDTAALLLLTLTPFFRRHAFSIYRYCSHDGASLIMHAFIARDYLVGRRYATVSMLDIERHIPLSLSPHLPKRIGRLK